MAQDPCAFNFIYTNYSDEKALFANFRHLQEHLNRIGCGSTTEEAEIILAADNSSNAAKERADVICTGADDDVEIQAAYDAIKDTGGRIIFHDGDYYLGETVNMSGQDGHIAWQGAGRATIHATSSISTLNGNRWLFQSLDNINAVGNLTMSFEGMVFDGDGVTNSCGIIVAGTTAHPNMYIVRNTFRDFKSRILYANYNNGNFIVIKDNHFVNCDLTDDDTAVGDKFGIQIQDGLADWRIWFCDNFLDNITLGSGTQGIVDFEQNSGYAFVQRNIVVSCDTPVFRDLGTAQATISNNWINGTYVLGDLAGATGVVNDTIADTKGDILTATAADTWDNFPAGSNQTVVVADSTQTFGLRYALPGGKDSVYGFYDVDLADALTADQMTRSVGVLGVTMAYPGSVVAIMVNSTEARTAGTATFEVFKNGTGIGLTAVLDGTNTTKKVTTQAFGTDTFVAGDVLDIRVTTASWTPTTADVEAGFVVQYDS